MTPAKSGFFERHRAKIECVGPGDCWLWAAGKNAKGYGQVWARGKNRYVHREAYEAVSGEGSADGLLVRHKCDTPACVNPDHLEIGTHADNMRDMVERGRQARVKGAGHSGAKLTEDKVRTIRADYMRGSHTHGLRAFARQYGVDMSLISMIVRRKIWAHI